MKIKTVIIFLLLAINTPLLVAEEQDVPKKLFEIPLGSVYKVNSDNQGNIPIKKFAGMSRFLGNLNVFYFEPLKAPKTFEYIEYRQHPEEEYFKTSYALGLLPIIPESIKSLDELEEVRLERDFEVVTITWSDISSVEDGDYEEYANDRYYWAIDLCEVFSVDLNVEPEILDYSKFAGYSTNWYRCKFSADDRVFSVDSNTGSIELSYSNEFMESKEVNIENTMNLLRAEEIRPY